MDGKTLQLYLDKIRPFKWFQASVFFPNDRDVDLILAPGEYAIRMTHENATKWLRNNPLPMFPFLFRKTDDLDAAYLWQAEDSRLETKALDAMDQQFLDDYPTLAGTSAESNLYGAHTVSTKCWGMFAPTLSDVIHLIAKDMPVERLHTEVERIYVTTEPFPSEDECYDASLGVHHGRTTCLVVPKAI